MPVDPKQVYEQYRQDPAQDMFEYSPVLREAARGNILEIGVRGGVSTSAFLLGLEENGGHLWSVDVTPTCGKLFEHPQWTFISANSRDVKKVREVIPQQLDILFIDGDHSYEGCVTDLINYAPMVKSGGKIFIHDVTPRKIREGEYAEGWPTEEVQMAVDAYLSILKEGTYKYEILPGQFGMGVLTLG